MLYVKEVDRKTRGSDGKPVRAEQKPVFIYKELILRDSEPQDVVCDLFCGSGTIAEAGLLCHRRVIACDSDVVACRATLTRAAATFEKVQQGTALLTLRGPKASSEEEARVSLEVPVSTPGRSKVFVFLIRPYQISLFWKIVRIQAVGTHQTPTSEQVAAAKRKSVGATPRQPERDPESFAFDEDAEPDPDEDLDVPLVRKRKQRQADDSPAKRVHAPQLTSAPNLSALVQGAAPGVRAQIAAMLAQPKPARVLSSLSPVSSSDSGSDDEA